MSPQSPVGLPSGGKGAQDLFSVFLHFQKADTELCKSADFNVGNVSVCSFLSFCLRGGGGAEEEQGWGMKNRESEEWASK